MTTERTIVFDNVSKFYGEVLGVNRVTLSLPPGVTSLVGPNGSGKTTLLNLMTGLVRPSRGRVSVLGMTPDDPEVFGRKVGYCTQVDAFPKAVTGRSFIRGWLRLSGLDRAGADRATVEALERVGMTEAADRKVEGYSKGMRQRIRLALALNHRPEVLVLDEPLNGLDFDSIRKVLYLLEKKREEGCALLMISHNEEIFDKITDKENMYYLGEA